MGLGLVLLLIMMRALERVNYKLKIMEMCMKRRKKVMKNLMEKRVIWRVYYMGEEVRAKMIKKTVTPKTLITLLVMILIMKLRIIVK